MAIAYTIIYHTLSGLLTVLWAALFLRAVTSWFDPTGEGRFSVFLAILTEPMLYPLRVLFEKRGWFQDSPVDMAFFVAVMLVGLLRLLLVFF